MKSLLNTQNFSACFIHIKDIADIFIPIIYWRNSDCGVFYSWLHILTDYTFITVICVTLIYRVGKQRWKVPKTKCNLHHCAIPYVCDVSGSNVYEENLVSVASDQKGKGLRLKWITKNVFNLHSPHFHKEKAHCILSKLREWITP